MYCKSYSFLIVYLKNEHAIAAALFSLDIMYLMEHNMFIVKDTSFILDLKIIRYYMPIQRSFSTSRYSGVNRNVLPIYLLSYSDKIYMTFLIKKLIDIAKDIIYEDKLRVTVIIRIIQ